MSAGKPKREFLFVKSDYKLIRINLNEVLYMAGLRDYTRIFLKGKSAPLTTLQNLKEFELKLPEDEFIRVHRSYIVSIRQVDTITKSEISISNHRIPIGHAYKPSLDKMIEKNS
ncbi:MAG: LytTR family transcriptional regulator [Sphingobacteriia bacterium]|nr:LytTR family transcriptional regulator [Sphingobacteriia bacterium]